MAEPKYTLSKTGAEVAEAITKALNSAQKATEPTKVMIGIDFLEKAGTEAPVYSARVIGDDTLELFEVIVDEVLEDIYQAEENTPTTA